MGAPGGFAPMERHRAPQLHPRSSDHHPDRLLCLEQQLPWILPDIGFHW